MFFNAVVKFSRVNVFSCRICRIAAVPKRYLSQDLEDKYSDLEKQKILQVINESDSDSLSSYNVSKGRLKMFTQWRDSNGEVKTISDIECIDGFSEKTAAKFFDSILRESAKKTEKGTSKLKGQILQPSLSEYARQACKTVLAVYISVNSVCWTLIDRKNYEVLEWHYHGIEYPEAKRLQITDILNIAWTVTNKLPHADIYVMKAEATALRAAGSDPNNPKVIAVNLQKSQIIAMTVALIYARHNSEFDNNLKGDSPDQDDVLKHRVYFLRPTLPYRLYGTLVGNENIATDQTVEMLLQESTQRSTTHVYVPDKLQSRFRNQNELQKDMLGHCFLLALTFMDLCIYKNKDSIEKLTRKRDK